MNNDILIKINQAFNLIKYGFHSICGFIENRYLYLFIYRRSNNHIGNIIYSEQNKLLNKETSYYFKKKRQKKDDIKPSINDPDDYYLDDYSFKYFPSLELKQSKYYEFLINENYFITSFDIEKIFIQPLKFCVIGKKVKDWNFLYNVFFFLKKDKEKSKSILFSNQNSRDIDISINGKSVYINGIEVTSFLYNDDNFINTLETIQFEPIESEIIKYSYVLKTELYPSIINKRDKFLPIENINLELDILENDIVFIIRDGNVYYSVNYEDSFRDEKSMRKMINYVIEKDDITKKKKNNFKLNKNDSKGLSNKLEFLFSLIGNKRKNPKIRNLDIIENFKIYYDFLKDNFNVSNLNLYDTYNNFYFKDDENNTFFAISKNFNHYKTYKDADGHFIIVNKLMEYKDGVFKKDIEDSIKEYYEVLLDNGLKLYIYEAFLISNTYEVIELIWIILPIDLEFEITTNIKDTIKIKKHFSEDYYLRFIFQFKGNKGIYINRYKYSGFRKNVLKDIVEENPYMGRTFYYFYFSLDDISNYTQYIMHVPFGVYNHKELFENIIYLSVAYRLYENKEYCKIWYNRDVIYDLNKFNIKYDISDSFWIDIFGDNYRDILQDIEKNRCKTKLKYKSFNENFDIDTKIK